MKKFKNYMYRYAKHLLLLLGVLAILFLFVLPIREHVTDQNPTYDRLLTDLCSLTVAVFMYLDDYSSRIPKELNKDAAQQLAWEAWKVYGGTRPLILKPQEKKFIDPWGAPLVIKIKRKRETNILQKDHKSFLVIIYSVGPNRKDENMKGDDVYCHRWLKIQ